MDEKDKNILHAIKDLKVEIAKFSTLDQVYSIETNLVNLIEVKANSF